MVKIDYLTLGRKKNWSNIVHDLPNYWSNSDVEVNLICGVGALFRFGYDFHSSNIIVINHSLTVLSILLICPWKLLGSTKVVLLKHESEQVLRDQWSFLEKVQRAQKFSHLFRYSGILTCLDFLVDRRIVLNEMQCIWNSLEYTQLHFLGVDQNIFLPSDSVNKSDKVMLAHSPKRLEKGLIPLTEYLDGLGILWTYPENIPYHKMSDFYSDYSVVLYGNTYETYGLTLIEAMLCNKAIVVGENIGLIMNLRQRYSHEYLEQMI